MTLLVLFNQPAGGGGGITGVAANTVTGFTSAGAGNVTVQGIGGSTTLAFTSAGTGATTIQGTGLTTVSDFTGTGTGVVGSTPVTGIGSNTVSNFSSSTAGTVAVVGTGTSTFAHTSAGTGAVAISGTGASTLAAFTTAGAGYVGSGSYTIDATRAALIYRIALLHGLDINNPLTVSANGRSAGTLIQTVSGATNVTVSTTSAPPFTGSLDSWIDALADLHGLTADLTVTPTTRSAGVVNQTLVMAGGVTTVTRA